jgi:hypothetical protein
LSLFHMCKVYILVEHEKGVRTFKSCEQRSWPPPDQRLVSPESQYLLFSN